jgi:two-component system chemotaxis response regulator CheB
MLSASILERTKIVVIGGSAGAIEVLRAILPQVPARLRQPIVVVVHVSPAYPSLLAELFAPRCLLRVGEPMDKQPIDPGIWFAPPGYHLLTEDGGTFALSVDEAVQYSRPSVSVLFESAAHAYGANVLAAVLTGANSDGAFGVERVLASGGVALAQSPDDAAMPMMPKAAIDAGATAASIEEIRGALIRMSEL